MKKVFKFTLAALAATVLASCSTDDFSDFGGGKNQLKKGGLVVEVENMIDPITTRGIYTDENKLYWQKKDQIFVYDETLIKYDKFQFDGDAFERTGKKESNLESVKYAAYVGNVAETNNKWEWKNNSTKLVTTIDPTWAWEETETTEGEEAYLSRLPMWGEAWENEDGTVGTTLRYLTGVLRVNLAYVPDNAKTILVRGWEDMTRTHPLPMTGQFEAQISENGETMADKNDIYLDPTTAPELGKDENNNYEFNNLILVDISKAKRLNTVVFIPLIKQNYRLLEVAVCNTDAETLYRDDNIYATVNGIVDAKDGNGNDVYTLKRVENLDVQRGYFYTLDGKVYNVGGSTINSLNMGMMAKLDGANLEQPQTIEVTSSETLVGEESGKTLNIPVDKGTITLNMKSLKGEKRTYPEGEGETLTIINEKFEGDLIINLPNGTSNIKNICIYLPKANVILKDADLSEVDLGEKPQKLTENANGGEGYKFKWNTLVVKSLKLASQLKSGKTDQWDWQAVVNNVYANAGTEEIIMATEGNTEIKGDLQLEKGSLVKKLDINGNIGGEVDLTVTSVPVDVTLKEGVTVGTLKAQKDLTLKNVTISELVETTENLTITDGTDVKNAKSDGVVTVNCDTGKGITGKLTVTNAKYKKAGATETDAEKAARTLHLNGGVIGELEVKNPSTFTTDVNVFIENAEDKGATEIGTVTATKGNIDKNYVSKWKGEAAVTHKNPAVIYTASQLATVDKKPATGSYTLVCSPNLDDNDWTPVELHTDFDGGGNTVENMKINNVRGNAGLFSKLKGNSQDRKKIEKLTIKSADVVSTGANTGALLGTIEGVMYITLKDITVESSSVVAKTTTTTEEDEDGNETKTTTEGDNVGGVVGNSGDSHLIVDNVKVIGTATKPTVIKARYYEGGLVGKAGNRVKDADDIATNKFGFTLNNTVFQNEKPHLESDEIGSNYQSENEAGIVGKICGFAGFDMNITFKEETGVDYNRKELGFGRRLKKNSWTNPGSGSTYANGDNQVWYGSRDGVIGMCDLTTGAKGGTGYVINGNKYGIAANTSDNKVKDRVFNVDPENDEDFEEVYYVNMWIDLVPDPTIQ